MYDVSAVSLLLNKILVSNYVEPSSKSTEHDGDPKRFSATINFNDGKCKQIGGID